jgi:biopolymer transport protein ExbD
MAAKGLANGGADDADSVQDEILAEINITPLVDVFLVLLIIFMVTATFITQQGVKVDLPKASAGTSQSQPQGVIVTLLPQGKLLVNQEPVAAGDYAAMETKIKAAFGKTESRLVILEGDRQAFLGSAVEVMDHARKAGADKFAISTATEK